MNNTSSTMNIDQPADWLGLARANAAVFNEHTAGVNEHTAGGGSDAGDLGRAILRLATLAAAAHRAALLDDAPQTASLLVGATQ